MLFWVFSVLNMVSLQVSMATWGGWYNRNREELMFLVDSRKKMALCDDIAYVTRKKMVVIVWRRMKASGGVFQWLPWTARVSELGKGWRWWCDRMWWQRLMWWHCICHVNYWFYLTVTTQLKFNSINPI